MYCTLIWCPYLLKDIQNIERIQHCATKFILDVYDSNYKTWLLILKLLPLMYLFELQDILFNVKSRKCPTKGFIQYILFSSSYTQSSSSNKLKHPSHTNNSIKHLFLMPSPLLTYIFPSRSSKLNLKSISGIILNLILVTTIHVPFIYYVYVVSATTLSHEL